MSRCACVRDRRKSRTATRSGPRIRQFGAASTRQRSSAIELTSDPKIAIPTAAVDGRLDAAQTQLPDPAECKSQLSPAADLCEPSARRARGNERPAQSSEEDDAPEIERLILGATDGMPDMKQRLEGARYESVALPDHPWPSEEVDRLLRIADEHVFKHPSFRRRDPSPLHRRSAKSSAAIAQRRLPP